MKNIQKKFQIIAYIFLLTFLILFIIYGFSTLIKMKKEKDKKLPEKLESEIHYLDENISDIFNKMNNIEIENYKISTNEVNTKSSSEEDSNENTGIKNKSKETQNQENEKSSNDEEKNTKIRVYDLNKENELTNKNQIDWIETKNIVETIYLSIPTITLDLYQSKIDKNDILQFNDEFDILTKAIEKEEKNEVLEKLVNVYEKLVKIGTNVMKNDLEKLVLETKLYLFKAYSKLDSNNWEEIKNELDKGIEKYKNIMAKKDIKEQKKYTINKTYVMLNELEKSISKKSVGIFLIKYKNIVEELNKM